jgi:transcriptional repressor NrdR
MRCPFCNHFDTSVKDSRTTDDNTSIRRRRLCEACGSRFTTFEHVQLRELNIVKKDGSRAPFERAKLVKSIAKAIHKRSVTQEQLERVVASIIRQIETSGETEIPSCDLGEKVMKALFHVDSVAYIRFLSVYKDFSSIDDFIDIVQNMKENPVFD